MAEHLAARQAGSADQGHVRQHDLPAGGHGRRILDRRCPDQCGDGEEQVGREEGRIDELESKVLTDRQEVRERAPADRGQEHPAHDQQLGGLQTPRVAERGQADDDGHHVGQRAGQGEGQDDRVATGLVGGSQHGEPADQQQGAGHEGAVQNHPRAQAAQAARAEEEDADDLDGAGEEEDDGPDREVRGVRAQNDLIERPLRDAHLAKHEVDAEQQPADPFAPPVREQRPPEGEDGPESDGRHVAGVVHQQRRARAPDLERDPEAVHDHRACCDRQSRRDGQGRPRASGLRLGGTHS
jgi:hypothetical protein